MRLQAAIEKLSYAFADEILNVILTAPLTMFTQGAVAAPAKSVRKAPKAKPATRKKAKPAVAPKAPSSLREKVEDLKSRRVARGLSQRQLAEKIGIKQPHVANVERHFSKPSDDLLRRWTSALA